MHRKLKKISPGVYEVDGKQVKLDAVTTLQKHLFPIFDADKIIQNMMESERWDATHKYWGMTPEQIKKLWADLRDKSADEGGKLHKTIELQLRKIEGLPLSKCLDSCNKISIQDPAFLEFKKFVVDYPDIVVHKVELCVFDVPSKILGIIDCIVMNDDGTVDVYDWKRKKEIGKFGRKFYHQVFGDVMDCDLLKGTFQLNMYRVILERSYALKVRKMVLLRFYPDELYERIECKKIPEMELWFDQRIG